MSNRKHRDNQEICARRVRELAQAAVNKHCFECGQPGVTYINITVGCFVCTSCSGMLRGLNPPHRVKSISMTTFSQQEVEFLQNHGNEVGKRTWLCIFDPKTDGCFDARDSQKLKEFLQDKYERKKWHFSKSKNRREIDGPFSPGLQNLPLSHAGPIQNQPPAHAMPAHAMPAHAMPHTARPTRQLSQSQMSTWERPPMVSPTDIRNDVFTARPTRSQSFRDPTIKDTMLTGVERQRPGSLSSGLGGHHHQTSFPALPRPSASSTFKNNFTLGRTLSAHGGGAPFRVFPKSLSVDFGGLGQQHSTLSTAPPKQPLSSQDRYAPLSQLNSVFSENTPASAAPSTGPSQYSTLFGNRVSSSSTPPASSPGVADPGTQTFANFPNPFNSTSTSQPALSPSNPFKCVTSDDSSAFVSTPSSIFPQSASFPASTTTHNAFPLEQANKQETNGFTLFPAPEAAPKVPRPMSVNPFTGTVYPSKGTSRNPFI
ncbi:arf-GAP domain and FG repeat-containing protein 2 isoform X2 [Clupea harengus]|uniref:Arf-GAP domain and FG repeat-containing protein 2 isoform X2 n=1 Tax=Clupea harengus TaxID=7950 RepID=A0A8M1KEG3_CLUHA|nr:arf-GAP domain and FG repeat-containing protein 2 isoform X2 [Clupea harengus]